MNAEFRYIDNCVIFENIILPNEKSEIRDEIYFSVYVVSERFSGYGEEFTLIETFENFFYELNELYELKRQEVDFRMGYGSGISFSVDKLGHLAISGKVVDGVAGANFINFEFYADQTVLRTFINQLKEVLDI